METLKLITILFLISLSTVFAQKSERVKYVTSAPDGSVAMTIIDDTRQDHMTLESAEDFYKYEIVDPKTANEVYAADNKGNNCAIDKTKIKAGTYNLKLYTNNFVITSKITVSASRKLFTQGNLVAMNEEE